MIIRNIDVNDAEAYWQMLFDLDKETKFMLYEPNERTKKLELINGLIERAVQGNNLLLVAENNGEIVGFISAQRSVPNRINHIAYIVVGVRKAFQGKGIGKEFFERLDLWACRNNIVRFELTVMCHNMIALHLYEKYGFVVEGVKKKAILMDGEYIDEFYMAKLF